MMDRAVRFNSKGIGGLTIWNADKMIKGKKGIWAHRYKSVFSPDFQGYV